SETDFVAKNEDFQNFVQAIAEVIAAENPADVEALKEMKLGAQTVGEALTEKIATIGENMNIRRFARIETAGALTTYTHAAGKIGVLIEADAPNNDDVTECLKNVAMQIAALNPKYLSDADVSEEYKNHEKEILIAQLKNDPKNASKPDNIIEKMITGRLAKELKEICLLGQEYVKAENKETVAQYVEAVGKKIGASVTLKQFVRFETGEGLEKKDENFADEVAKMMGN
ncbi:MAG: translation elongation factor Ts, partial [Clostridia bacterium]|nr:translation elongation factor Ts [Clostridia bacterium]